MAKTKLYTFYMSPYGAPTKHMVKMASLVVTCMPSSNLKRTKRQRSAKTSRFFVASPATLSCMVPGQLLFSRQAGS